MTGRGILWVALRVAIFVVIAAIAIAFQLDRAANIRPGLAAFVPAGLGGFAEAGLARSQVIDNPSAALAMATSVVRHRPVSATHLSTLALAAVENDQPEIAGKALQLAALRGWRDTYVQATIMASAVDSDRMDIAAQRIDALARTARDRDLIQAGLRVLLADGRGRMAVAHRMAAGSAVAGSMTELARIDPAQVQPVVLTFEASQSLKPEIPCDTYAALTRTLLAVDNGSAAMRAWPARCSKPGSRSIAFDLDADEADPFAWRYPSGAGISLREGGAPGAIDIRNRDVLRRDFATRFLTLPPGDHRLVLTRADGDSAGIGHGPRSAITVLLRCDRKGGRGGGALVNEQVKGPVEFAVRDGCATQYVSLAASQGSAEAVRIRIE